MRQPAATPPKTLLASPVVFGRYEGFIPLYVFTFLRAYPEHFVRVMFFDRMGGATRRALGVIRGALSDRFEVVESACPGLDRAGCDGMAFRWLLGREHFAGFDYGLIGDVDILVVREEPPLLDQEVARADALGKPYANVVRDAPGHRHEMGGCHFLAVGPYFSAMQPLIEEARADTSTLVPPARRGGEQWRAYNENLLYRLVKRGLGVHEADEPRPFSWNSEHGFHLGITRIGLPLPDWYRDDRHWRREGQAILSDPRFTAIRALTPPWIVDQLDALERFLG